MTSPAIASFSCALVTAAGLTGACLDYPAHVSTNSYGKCLVASRDIEPGSVVARFEGPIVTYDQVPLDEIIYVAYSGNGCWVIPKTDARFINHSCNPNCAHRGSELLAVRPIKKGEEITFDYVTISPEICQKEGDELFWDDRWTFQCQCGDPHCYGLIDDYFVKFADGSVKRRRELLGS